jgi:RIO kinase 1
MNTSQILERYSDYEKYEEYETIYQKKNVRAAAKSKTSQPDWTAVVTSLADEDDTVQGFLPTYAAPLDPRHYERTWIINSLGSFYQENIIVDVTRLVKAGKEANVYCCEAHPAADVPLIAAKLYRPRMLRTLKNDAIYKEGRTLRGADGKEVRKKREIRALEKKTRFGKHLDTITWIENEFQVQQLLYKVGADVPQPIAHGGNSILMTFLGDDQMTAPTLSDVSLDRSDAQPLYERVMWNVELMLRHHYVHGDLSAYNILYWDGRITLIDFPQVVDARSNGNAFMLLERDIKRVSDYFARFGATTDPVVTTARLWERYMQAKL